MKKIAIWAPLRYANYGDDMQAIAFALFIKQLGYDVKLFQLEEELSKIYGLESVSTVDDLCKGVNLCVIAGGALLTPFNLPKRLLNKAAVEYERDFKDLYEATRKYKTLKFCAVSMGGDGLLRSPWMWYSKSRIKFFKCDSFINGTVRLSGDVLQMAKFGKDFKFYPDMLFRVADYFIPQKLPQTDKIRIGFNFKKGRFLDQSLLEDIFKYAEINDNIEFHFTTTHMEKIGLNYQYLPPKESKNIFIDRYETPNQLLGVLSSMDVVVTSMLHVGLTGLVMGTPFLSYRGPGKTKSFLRSIGGDWAILPENVTFEQLREKFFVKKKEDLYQKYNLSVIKEMIIESEKQYVFCKDVVEKFG